MIKCNYSKVLRLIIFLFYFHRIEVSCQEVNFKIPIPQTQDSLIFVDSVTVSKFKTAKDTEWKYTENKVTKVYLKKKQEIELIFEIEPGVFEVLSIYYGRQTSGDMRKRISIIYKFGENMPMKFISAIHFPKPNKRFSYQLGNGLKWMTVVTDKGTAKFSRFHNPANYRNHEISKIDWFGATSFEVFYKPEMKSSGFAKDSITEERVRVFKKVKDPIKSRIYAGIDNKLIWLKSFDGRLQRDENLLRDFTLINFNN